MPISFTVPETTASGRSVFSRITSTGLPRLGASSWTPPESVRTMFARLSARVNWAYGERFDEEHVVDALDSRSNRGANLRILVDREHDSEIRVLACKVRDGAADVLHRGSQVLAAMRGDQQDPILSVAAQGSC